MNDDKALIQLDDYLFVVKIDSKSRINRWISSVLLESGNYLKLVIFYSGYLDKENLTPMNYDLFQVITFF